MKKTLLALSLIGCLLLSAASCTNQDDQKEEGTKAPISNQIEETTSGTPSTNNAQSAPEPTDTNDTSTKEVVSGLENGEANTETGYGPLHPVH